MRSDYLCCQNPTPPNTWLTTYATAGKISTEADSVMKRILLFTTIFLALLINRSTAQELNCQVSVLTPQIQQTDKTLFETMQNSIREFMNNRVWTQDKFLNQERIDCSITITISERVSVDEFRGNIQIQARRPVYKTSYNSPLFNHQDNDLSFRYLQDQVLEYDESNISSSTNLTAILAFYAYIILALDYDSFSKDGGTPYFVKAQTIVNNAQAIPERGWKAFESNRNRYWFTENYLNVSFKPLRNCIYQYHRLGMDRLTENIQDGRAAITEALKQLRTTYADRPNSIAMQSFFNAKSDEIVNLYSQAQGDERNQVVPVLSLVDPANTLKYQNMGQTK